jgi:superfamily II DNA or RNA helicase
MWDVATLNELTKLADAVQTVPVTPGPQLVTQLLPHQQRVVDKIQHQPGLVVAHGLGSGKTLTSIGAALALKPENAQVLVPAALRSNYEKEIAQHTRGQFPGTVGSLQGAVVKQNIPKTDLLIVDEAHRAKDPGSKTFQTVRDAEAAKRLLLTASPVYNKPQDIASLVDLAAGDRVLPLGTDFESRYITKPEESWVSYLPFVHAQPGVRHKRELQKILQKWVDYQASEGADFPQQIDKTVNIKMTPRQSELHAAAWGDLPFLSRWRLRKGLPPTKQDLSAINKFEAQTRQISGSERRFVTEGQVAQPTPKVMQAIGSLEESLKRNPAHKSLVYSNFLDTLSDYEDELKKRNIPYAKFIGGMTKKQRKQIVDDYNSNRIKALLVSTAGGEGLDLKGTRSVQVLEPHWNEEKIRQVVGRAVRRGSHADLPPDQRRVDVEHYIAHPTGFFGQKKPGVESYLQSMSENKAQLNQKILDLIKQSALRCFEAMQ